MNSLVLAQHKYSQRAKRVEARNFLDLVVVKIEEDQPLQTVLEENEDGWYILTLHSDKWIDF